VARRTRASEKNSDTQSTGANLGFETKLWAAADKLRNNMDAAEYKHVVLGLIILKYISYAFDERHSTLDQDLSDPASQWYIREPQARYLALEDPDEYRMENIFWYRKKPVGKISRETRSSPRSGNLSMTRWWRSSSIIPHSKVSCPRTTTGRRSTSSDSAN